MLRNDRRAVLMILASVVLFIGGMYIYGPLAEFLLPDIDGVKYQVDLGHSFDDVLIFSFFLALVPVCILITWFICGARTRQDRVTISSLIIVITVLTVFVRQQILYAFLKKLSEDVSAGAVEFGIMYPLSETGFVWYMFAGLLGGSLLTCIIYLRKN